MFLIRYYAPTIGTQVVSLRPRPTTVDYPESRLLRTRTSKDGNTIVQRPMRDPRPRKWTWEKYRSNVPLYESQWQFLASLECQARWDAGLADTSIEIWENDSLTGGFDKLTDENSADLITYTNLNWTRVQVLQATRTIRQGGGSVVYEQSIFEFVIDDDFYTSF